jgi:Protein tyrosine and serine/threonine kinase
MRKRNPANTAAQLWTCPEVLRADTEGTLGTLVTKESDVFSFAIILQEIILRSKPYSMYDLSSSGK